MERAGLKNEDLIFANIVAGEHLRNAETNLYETQRGKEAETAAKNLTRILTKAIAANDLVTIIELERQAIERDIACYGAEDRRTNALGSLEQAAHLIQRTSTPEGAREYLISMNGGVLPKSIPSSDLVQNFIKNQKAQLTQMIGATTSPALMLYRTRRKEALEHLRKEHIKNLNRGLDKKIENDHVRSR